MSVFYPASSCSGKLRCLSRYRKCWVLIFHGRKTITLTPRMQWVPPKIFEEATFLITSVMMGRGKCVPWCVKIYSINDNVLWVNHFVARMTVQGPVLNINFTDRYKIISTAKRRENKGRGFNGSPLLVAHVDPPRLAVCFDLRQHDSRYVWRRFLGEIFKYSRLNDCKMWGEDGLSEKKNES